MPLESRPMRPQARLPRTLLLLLLPALLTGCGGNENAIPLGVTSELSGNYEGTYADSSGGAGRIVVTIGAQGAIRGTLSAGSRLASLSGGVDNANAFDMVTTFLDGDRSAFHITGILAKTSAGLSGTGTRAEPTPITFSFTLNRM